MGRGNGVHAARAALGEPPSELRASKLVIGNGEYVVLSFPACEQAHIPGLSSAESEVLRAALGGLSNSEIAAIRRRSVFTIQNQLATAYRKLGVSSRSEAALKLAELEADTDARESAGNEA